MDTTHTFHFPFREITINLLNFVAITGLSFFEDVIPFNDVAYYSATTSDKWNRQLFRVTITLKDGCSLLAQYTEFVPNVRIKYDVEDITLEQLA